MLPNDQLKKTAILTALLVLVSVGVWEGFWRSQGYPVSFNDDMYLWARFRKKIYLPADQATVFIGSSRNKFDVDIALWEALTGEQMIQLSFVGTNPRPLLNDLAADEKFSGKLVIDVTEDLFFSVRPGSGESADKALEYYKNETYAQKAGSWINLFAENYLVFLQKEYAINDLITDLRIPNREGVFGPPIFPKKFDLTNAKRQSVMAPEFVLDTAMRRQVTDLWTMWGGLDTTFTGIRGDTLQTVLQEVKTAVDKIISRGGQVIFIRTPESGPLVRTNELAFPRKDYWDVLLKFTGQKGIHYQDYPELSHFECPEWSHLSPQDALIYTRKLLSILQDEKGWAFAKKINTATSN